MDLLDDFEMKPITKGLGFRIVTSIQHSPIWMHPFLNSTSTSAVMKRHVVDIISTLFCRRLARGCVS